MKRYYMVDDEVFDRAAYNYFKRFFGGQYWNDYDPDNIEWTMKKEGFEHWEPYLKKYEYEYYICILNEIQGGGFYMLKQEQEDALVKYFKDEFNFDLNSLLYN